MTISPAHDSKGVVLVVEDEPILLLHAVDIAEDAGFEAIKALNADQAIGILESGRDVDIVMTDINMPGGMDGMKLAAAIRDRWPPIHIIVVSGYLAERDVRLPKGSAFLAKPYDDRKLTAKLNEFAARPA